MKKKIISACSFLLLFIAFSYFCNLSQAGAQCNIVWSGDYSGSVSTDETLPTEIATSLAFIAIYGFEPVECVNYAPGYTCFDRTFSEFLESPNDALLVFNGTSIVTPGWGSNYGSSGEWDVVCAPDTDGDGINDDYDNCPDVSNPGQEDADLDGVGDICDSEMGCFLEWWTDSSGCSSCGGLMDYSCDYDCDFIATGTAVTSETARSQQAAVKAYQNIFWPQYSPVLGNCYNYYYFSDFPVEQISQKVCIDGTWTYSESAYDDTFNYSYSSSSSGGWDVICAGDDDDNDGVLDTEDNCRNMCNQNQLDADGDGIGDVCDNTPGCGGCGGVTCEQSCDLDIDGILNSEDNCPSDCNIQQLDTDVDGIGDVCDDTSGCGGCGQPVCEQTCTAVDPDDDGLFDMYDNCPYFLNPDQEDADTDGIGDVCDTCPNDAANDADGDGLCGDEDNCPDLSNLDQHDCDNDGQGDICDADTVDPDGDGIDADCDNCPSVSNSDQADCDDDGIGDACDDPCVRFVDNGDGTVTDLLTSLIWLKNAGCYSTGNWNNAVASAAGLNSGECGLTDGSVEGDWHLATIDEFQGIGTEPPTSWGEGEPTLTFTVPFAFFTNIQEAYWSGTDSGSEALFIVMIPPDGSSSPGYAQLFPKTSPAFTAWPVRDPN